MSLMRYLGPALAVTFGGLVLAGWIGWSYSGSLSGAASFLLIGSVLAVLEISLSFDNAIVNANKLKHMTPIWRQRFLTWGILIAVFGMRIVFPLAVVVIAARVGPWQAVMLAATAPDEYARIIGGAHLSIAAFGGAFLMMVALGFFVDTEKDIDWIGPIEAPLRRSGTIKGLEILLVLLIVLGVASVLPAADVSTFLFSALAGLATYLAVDGLGHVLDGQAKIGAVAQGGLGAFLYLEVLDASFSFDGVIGAFALTQNLFLIAIGLGIGAMYVRSMTIMLVDRGTLAEFRYLEHGAFWSILVLSVIMFVQTLWHVPEVVTGLLGAGLIALSLLSSLRHRSLEAPG